MKTLRLYLRAFLRSFLSYESDCGGWRSRLQWELGWADARLGRPCRNPEYDSPYEHGFYIGSRR